MSRPVNTKCYACPNPGTPRDIGGTKYSLCDSCYQLHVVNNNLAIAVLQAQLILRKEATRIETLRTD